MRSLLYIYILIVMLLTTNCMNDSVAVDPDGGNPVGVTDSVAVGLGVSFNQKYTKTSRMAATAAQTNGNFRGIDDFFIIPYTTEGVIGPNDSPLKPTLELGRYVSASRLLSNNTIFYKPVFVPKLTASFLVYGHAPASSDPFAYGSLSGFNTIDQQTKTSDITFSLDPIFTATEVPAIAQELADYLTSIATVQNVLPTAYYGDIFNRVQRSPIYRWSNPDSYSHSVLAEVFEFLSNSDRVMGGSSSNLNRLLTVIYNRLYSVAQSDPTTVNYYTSNSIAEPLGTIYPYREMATAIRDSIANTDFVMLTGYGDNVTVTLKSPRHQYPASIDLPDGAAGLQWNASEQAFKVVMQTKASAKVMASSRFCYPPFLCYYANSRIKISDVDSEEDHYASADNWSQILNEYYSTSTYVNSKTKAIAITDAINYGVAQLRISLKPTLRLRDRGEVNEIMVTGTNFPLTAVLVGPQYDVAYNFNPLQSSDEHTVYDRQIVDANNQSVFLLPYESTAFTQTLVLPTRKDEQVYFILEFENRSGVDFNGTNGVILNGSKFYMTAKLDPKDGMGYDADDDTMNRVFAQDGYTEVSCVLKDLKGAWNVVPDTRDPQLEIGVSMETKWIQSTTTNVKLD